MSTRVLLLLGLVFLAGLFVGGITSFGPESAPETVSRLAPAQAGQARSRLTEGERRDIDIFRSASRSTVFINQIAVQRRGLFSLDETRQTQGTGTGIVWDASGHILTNYHVVDRRFEHSVVLWDQTEWDAEIVGLAPGKDLAVLRIAAPEEKLHPIAVGSSADLSVGQKVLALGNPFGLDQTLTTGIISALGRDLQSPDRRVIRDVIQTDAAINPGNSGGPLLDSSGRLIGVNTAIASPSGAYAGIGFAIPVDTVSRLVPQLIRFGKPIQPGIGVSILTDYHARSWGIRGVVVTGVLQGSPAARAGIEPARRGRRGTIVEDIIVGVNGKRIGSVPELQDAFEAAGGVGANVTLTLENGRDRREVEVELIEVN